jgi:hypothetical protein
MTLAIAEADVVEQLRRTLEPRAFRHLRLGHRKRDVLHRRKNRQQIETLKHEADIS